MELEGLLMLYKVRISLSLEVGWDITPQISRQSCSLNGCIELLTRNSQDVP